MTPTNPTIEVDSSDSITPRGDAPDSPREFPRMQAENGKYSLQIKRMTRLGQDQEQLKQAVRRRVGYRKNVRGGWAGPTTPLLPPVAQSLLQRHLSHNAWTLTHAHVALAFCRNRRRAGSPEIHTLRGAYAWAWIQRLSESSGWTNPEALKAQYAAWRAWSDSFALGVALPRPITLPWQRECLRRGRALKRKPVPENSSKSPSHSHEAQP